MPTTEQCLAKVLLLWGKASDSSYQSGLISWIQPHGNVAVVFLAAGPVTLHGSMLGGAHGLCTGSRRVCETGTPEALLEALCVLPRDWAFWRKRLMLLQSTAGLRLSSSALGEGAFPPKFLSQSQELPFLSRLVAGPHSSSHLSTSRRHTLLLCFSHQRDAWGNTLRWKPWAAVQGASGLSASGWLWRREAEGPSPEQKL